MGKQIRLSYKLRDNFIDEVKSVGLEFLDVLNSMEAFSVFFISRVAAEEIAFSSVGETFCKTAKQFLPIIVLTGKGHSFSNLVKLFLIWNERIESRNAFR